MIQASAPVQPVLSEPEPTPAEQALALAIQDEFRKNAVWFGTHAKEIRDSHAGRFICVAGQELFVGADPAEVCSRAKAAHPVPGGGFFTKRISPHRGPKIYANQRHLG